MAELIPPTVTLRAAWLEAHDEWGPGFHEDGFGLAPSDQVGTPDGFAAWIKLLNDESEAEQNAAQSAPGCTYRWIVEGGQVLGGIALRHGYDDFVLRLGHIGYGIRPSARRRGLATWALGEMLNVARARGMGKILIVCEADNAASAKTIERQGGVLEAVEDADHGPVRRYWITVTERTTHQTI